MKNSSKLINAGITVLLIAMLGLINYKFYAFAYKISILISILAVCTVLQFCARKIENCVMIWAIAAVCIGIFIVGRPAYTVTEAKALVKEQYPEYQDPSLAWLIGEVSEQDELLEIQNYVFTYEGADEAEKIIVSPKSGQISVME